MHAIVSQHIYNEISTQVSNKVVYRHNFLKFIAKKETPQLLFQNEFFMVLIVEHRVIKANYQVTVGSLGRPIKVVQTS